MKHPAKQLLSFFLAAALSLLLFLSLYTLNARSPRIRASRLSPAIVYENGPVLLEGGVMLADPQGNLEYCLSFQWSGPGCLYLPRTSALSINGILPPKEEVYRGELYALPPSQDGRYEIRLSLSSQRFPAYQKAVYLGTFSQIHDFVAASVACNYYIQGLCFAVMLFSFVLFFWKRSERYLVWLALFAFFVGSYERLQDILQFLIRSPLLAFFKTRPFYRILNETLVAFFQYKILRHILPVHIGRRPFLPYVLLAAAPAFFFCQNPFLSILAISFFYLVLYACFLLCFLRLPAKFALERRIFLVSWSLTAVTRAFDQLCELGLVPYGDIDLRLRFRGIVSCIYVIAFFLIACKRFAQKFQEADLLNVHLEEEIQKKSRQQTAFIRSMLHNLKTPLFSLSGYSDMALNALARHPDTAGEYIRRVREKALYAGHMMDQIFFITQMEAGLIQLQALPVNLADLIRSALDTSRPEAEKKQIRISFDAPDTMASCGDPLYLQQAFQNILDNAFVHTPANGRIRIAGKLQKDRWQLIFADSGCGISQKDQQKIFDAYYSHRPDGVRSSGLGLYIAKEIITRFHGSIAVESTPGEGARFILLLPCSRPSEAQTECNRPACECGYKQAAKGSSQFFDVND